MTDWYSLSIENIFDKLQTSEHGLSSEEVLKRTERNGLNALVEKKPDSIFKIFFAQFKNPLIYILFICSVIVLFLGEITDALIVLAVIIFNSIIGTVQEGKAQNTLLALKKFSETSTTVLRGGKEFIVNDKNLVVGDILIIQEGEKIPADARIISSNNLKIDESSITGESVPLYKNSELLLEENLSIHSQKNMVFKGTNVVSGNARVVVVESGVNTYIGKISKEISDIYSEIPLKKQVKKLSNILVVIVALVSVAIFIYGIMNGYSTSEIFIVVVSLAVSAIPEGLPIVITLVLAGGVWRMSKKNVLVKKLQAVEALGQATIIAVDKTGTITKNELIVSKVWVKNQIFNVTGNGYEPIGEISLNEQVVSSSNHLEFINISKIAVLSSGARTSFNEESNSWKISGDPTEAAMLVLGQKIGIDKNDLLKDCEVIAENPFDFKLKYHSFIYSEKSKNNLVVVGAPEVVLKLCELSEKKRNELERTFIDMSFEGLRVISIAIKKDHKSKNIESNINDLEFLGFIAMKDTLRVEVAEAMQNSLDAGIKVIMITGDHKITATTIARAAGIFKDGDDVITGDDLERLSEEEILLRLKNTSVFARVTPEKKSQIINLYKKSGEIIAMTGDGVNDAPSLVSADLGVAMGKIGTEVAKEAADIILLDDNFGNIVKAVEEGRSIYKTIKRVVLYLFSTSAGEMFTIIAALFVLGYPLPILAAQIIWLNLVTDGFLDVALSMEPKQKGLLSKKFKRSKHGLFDKTMTVRMIIMSTTMMVGTLVLFGNYFQNDIEKAWTISMTTLAVFQWFNAWNCRSENESIFKMNPFSNKYLILATLIVVGLQFLAVYNPFMQSILSTVPLSLNEWLIIVPVSASIILVEELRKLISKLYVFRLYFRV